MNMSDTIPKADGTVQVAKSVVSTSEAPISLVPNPSEAKEDTTMRPGFVKNLKLVPLPEESEEAKQLRLTRAMVWSQRQKVLLERFERQTGQLVEPVVAEGPSSNLDSTESETAGCAATEQTESEGMLKRGSFSYSICSSIFCHLNIILSVILGFFAVSTLILPCSSKMMIRTEIFTKSKSVLYVPLQYQDSSVLFHFVFKRCFA